jgi:hypothetical protein
MQNQSIYKILLLISIVAFFAACDKDFNEIGLDVIGDDHFGLIKDDSQTVLAYNTTTGQVETSNLPINSLGYYNNPFFWKNGGKCSFSSIIRYCKSNHWSQSYRYQSRTFFALF